MDTRLFLLLHTLHGLKLDPTDRQQVLGSAFQSKSDFEQGLSLMARTYLREHKDWWDSSERVLERSRQKNIQWSVYGDECYPLLWLNLSDPPLLFSYQGQPCWRTHALLAVVGSRTPMTDTRLWMQRELGEFIRLTGIGVASGGARGVDQFAHRLSLDYRRPTVCVLPSGLERPYPFDNEKLWRQIVEQGGAMLSTFALDENLRKWAFHVRNRWITGLSPVCFVVEANRRSGSALTARLASEEGREICTLPVFPHSHQGLANLDLMESGAQMLRSSKDLIQYWNKSCPVLFQTPQGESQKDTVDQPKPQ